MGSNSIENLAYLFMREGMRPFRAGTNVLRVEAGFEDRPDTWLITIEDTSWRLQHETGGKEDLIFATEKETMDYLWPRLMEPLPPQP